MLNDKLYNALKWITLILLPGLGTLYFGLASIWGFPYAEQIIGTISAVTVFLGLLLGISSAQYNKGQTTFNSDDMRIEGAVENDADANE